MDPAYDGTPPANPILRHMAILSAARDFGVSAIEVEQVARRFDPLTTSPNQLADALAELLLRPSAR